MDIKRALRSLAREGLDVSREGDVYTIKQPAHPHAPTAEVLLPADFPLERKALHQLAALAAVTHPHGGEVTHVCASPDFHPGDGGIAIGSIFRTRDLIVPQAVGTDICCGMRLYVADLSLDDFLAKKKQLVEVLKGDYLLGTRDVEVTAKAARAMFEYGLPSWVEEVVANPRGSLAQADLAQVQADTSKVMFEGALPGSLDWVPDKCAPETGMVRDESLGTIGSGNHFVEVQVVDSILDGPQAFAWGVKKGQMAFMLHSGSRMIGMHVGRRWQERAREAWPSGVKYPKTGLFPLHKSSPLLQEYLEAENTAANYAFVNRTVLGELLRRRLRQVYGDLEVELVYDLPHNLTFLEEGHFITRKGACPAHEGQPIVIPGSMGSPSFLLRGNGHPGLLSSASHGRARSRGEMSRAALTHGIECITLKEDRRIEEDPGAYKPIQPVIDVQVKAGLVTPVAKMLPILTFKA